MTRIFAALAPAAILLATLAAAPAAAAERRFTVTDFDRIVVEGPYRVAVATGGSPSASASGPADALDRLTVEVQGRTLRIRADRTGAATLSPRAAGPVSLTVSAHELRSARVAGAANLAIDRVGGLRVDLTIEGSGRIAVANASGDNLVIGALGSGRIEVAGHVKEVQAGIHGWAELDASSLAAERVRLVTDTAGRVALAARDEATVAASGIGEVEIAGSPACTVRGASAGQVVCGTGR